MGRGHQEAATESFEKAIASDRLENTERASALASLSEMDALGGHFVKAENRLKEAMDIVRNAGDKHGEAQLLVKFSVLAGRRGKYAEAQAVLNQAGALFAQLGDDRGRDEVRRLLGSVLVGVGEYAEAEPC
jgi:tetratricopeptide (TPR) repeat protein